MSLIKQGTKYAYDHGDLPEPQNFGSSVIAFVSSPSGTSKTSLTALMAYYLANKIITPKSNCLFISGSFTWEFNWYLERTLKLKNRKHNFLNKLVHEKIEMRKGGNYIHRIKWNQYIAKPIPGLGIIASEFSGSEEEEDSRILAELIREARSSGEYDLIILDTKSGPLGAWLPFLSAVNQVILPFSMMSWEHHLNAIRETEDAVAQLRILGYPINICGIVPVAPKPNNPKTSELINLSENGLIRLFGNLILPTYFHHNTTHKHKEKMREEEYLSSFSNLIEAVLKLGNHKPSILRSDRRVKDGFVYECVRDRLHDRVIDQKNLSYQSIADYINKNFKREIRERFNGAPEEIEKYWVQRTFDDLTILGNKTQAKAERIYLSGFKGISKQLEEFIEETPPTNEIS